MMLSAALLSELSLESPGDATKSVVPGTSMGENMGDDAADDELDVGSERGNCGCPKE